MRIALAILIILFAITVVTLAYTGTEAITRSGRARAIRRARWAPATVDYPDGRVEITIQRSAVYRGEQLEYGRLHVEWLPATGDDAPPDGTWQAAYTEAWGRAEDMARTRNLDPPH